MTPAPHTSIRRAAITDLPALAEPLTEAFLHGDLEPWLSRTLTPGTASTAPTSA